MSAEDTFPEAAIDPVVVNVLVVEVPSNANVVIVAVVAVRLVVVSFVIRAVVNVAVVEVRFVTVPLVAVTLVREGVNDGVTVHVGYDPDTVIFVPPVIVIPWRSLQRTSLAPLCPKTTIETATSMMIKKNFFMISKFNSLYLY